jgi:hypothetical protein
VDRAGWNCDEVEAGRAKPWRRVYACRSAITVRINSVPQPLQPWAMSSTSAENTDGVADRAIIRPPQRGQGMMRLGSREPVAFGRKAKA